MKRARVLRPLAVLTAALVVFAACGGDDDDDAANKSTTTKKAASTTTTAAEAPAAPLTGAPDTGGLSATRPAMTVKVENTKDALPQWGIDKADVVYEEIVESNITRLAAMFNSQAPDRIGPIRSVRRTDASIVWPLGGIFVYSGGAKYAVDSISQAPVKQLDETRAGDAMFRDKTRRAPHNLYGIGEKLFAKAPDASPVPPPALFKYRADDEPAAGTPAASVAVTFKAPQGGDPTWTWNAATGTYTRHIFGADAKTGDGQPIAPQNVVVMFVQYKGGTGVIGAEAEMTGTGDVWVFSGGNVVKGTWQRPNEETPARLVDTSGADITLTPGQTWVELPATGALVTIT